MKEEELLEVDVKKTKVSDLSGTALDWAVAKCEGIATTPRLNPFCFWVLPDLPGSFSKEWAYGGPIIEREGISSLYLYVTDDPFRWAATQKPTILNIKPASVYGPTLLIAAMRCYVASKLGDEIEIPDEL